jgi:hypothetical protein
MNETTAPAPQQLSLTVNARGELRNTEGLSPELIAQMSTPEARARIRGMYKDFNGTGRRETRVAPEVKSEHRNFTNLKPPGMSNAEFTKLRRSQFRAWTKNTLKMQRRQRHGESAGSKPNQGDSTESSNQFSNATAQSADQREPAGECAAAE